LGWKRDSGCLLLEASLFTQLVGQHGGSANGLLDVAVLLQGQAVLIPGAQHLPQQSVAVGRGLAILASRLKEQDEAVDLGVEVVQVMQGNRFQ
jgi:hypothetical protein